MDRVGLFQRLWHVEIRRLLFIIGMVVAVAVVFQCFLLPYGKSLSPVDKGTTVMMVSNATILDDAKLTKTFVADLVVNDSYASGSEEEDSFHKYKDQNSQNEFTFKKRTIGYVTNTDDSSTQVKAQRSRHNHLEQGEKTRNSYKINNNLSGTTPVIYSQIPMKGIEDLDASSRTSDALFTGSTSPVGNVKQTIETQQQNTKLLQTESVILNDNSTAASISLFKRWNMQPISIFQMNSIYLQGLVSSQSPRPKWSSARDRELLSAKLKIENAPILRNTSGLHASIFRNISMFKRSYELMERILKVYIYKEGEKPIFHQPKMRGIYASEGWFMKLVEGNKNFIVRNPGKAHLFYLPISVQMLRASLGQDFQSHKDLQKHLKKYVELIAGKYKFWNRTGGTDHFLVACHDWAPKLTKQHTKNSIRVLCNANAARDFKIGKDTTLPVTYIRSMEVPLEHLGGKPPSERSILAFFAGSMHGYLRPILLQHWENKEPDMKILGPMARDFIGKRNYREHMKSSKYCICARGYEVHTPRVVEAIFHECVPVIISDNYVPPFFEVLNWEAFSVFVLEKDIPNLRNILLSIPEEKYLLMQSRVKMVQKHFLWHKKPLKYDLFHMILHSVWFNRVFQTKTR